MVKNTVIFSDTDRSEKTQLHSLKHDVIEISRIEYKQIIKDAYQEGREDAFKEKNDFKTVEQKGKDEAIKQHAKKKEENRQRLESIVARQDIELLHAESVFPFTFFTDTLIIDTTKISIAKKQLFATEYITTIPFKDLSDVNLQTYLFLGTLTLKYMPQSTSPGMNNPVTVKIPNLTRRDAIRAKNILKGALVAKAEEIDIARLSPQEIEEVLHKFGQSEGVI